MDCDGLVVSADVGGGESVWWVVVVVERFAAVQRRQVEREGRGYVAADRISCRGRGIIKDVGRAVGGRHCLLS